MSKVIVRHIIGKDRFRVVDNCGPYVISQLYSNCTDHTEIFSYLCFEQINAESSDKVIERFYATHDYIDRYNEGFIIGRIVSFDSEAETYTAWIEVNATDTDTEGSKAYLVALACGGEMGAPEYRFFDFQIIHADGSHEAAMKYNEINNCNYFWGRCIGEVVEYLNDEDNKEEEINITKMNLSLITQDAKVNGDKKINEYIEQTDKKKLQKMCDEMRGRGTSLGFLSDGYHTFDELYHHRAVLFATICKGNPLFAWKSKKHHEGTMFEGMFIVGINTPAGQATYHYNIDPYWDKYFGNVKEVEFAPEWDGHTPEQAIERIFTL